MTSSSFYCASAMLTGKEFNMDTYNIHAEHGPQGQGEHGAVGVLKELVVEGLVKNRA